MSSERIIIRGKRLGRHVCHDEQSRAYPAPRAHALVSVIHKRRVPIYDQGEVMSCTGNALAGCLSTAPYGLTLGEDSAIAIYSRATQLDAVRGVYPPNDTGSSGLAVMKVAKQIGWISRYSHAFGIDHFLAALVLRPGIVGLTWRSEMDSTDRRGLVTYGGPARSGHEIEALGLDVELGEVVFANSWGPNWGGREDGARSDGGSRGFFRMTFDDVRRALNDSGDATFAEVPAVAP